MRGDVEKILSEARAGALSDTEAAERLRSLVFSDLGFARVDHLREANSGYPEVIFCAGKTPGEVSAIGAEIAGRDGPGLLCTRAEPGHFEALLRVLPKAEYHERARLITLKKRTPAAPSKSLAVVTAGTSDIPVAEEAAITAEMLGIKTNRIYDVGVAGIHRLFSALPEIKKAGVVIAVAGMEGALASVLGGLVSVPVIAVPTSVGYGASFHGLAALLAMLNSCSAGIAVQNIDNGFGAAFLAGRILRNYSL